MGGGHGMEGHGDAGMGDRPRGDRKDDGNIIINNNVNSGGCDKGGNVEDMAEKIAMAVMRRMKGMMMGHDMDKEHMDKAQVEPEADAPKKEKTKNKKNNNK